MCVSVFHTQITTKQSAVQLVHHPSTIAPCQSPTTPCLSACHTHQSITLLPQLLFLLLNVVFFIVIILVTIESVVMMECITCLHQSSTRCVCATLVPSSVVITLLWCFGCGACCSPCHCASHMHHIWTVDVVEWHPRGFTISTCPPTSPATPPCCLHKSACQ